MRPRFFNLIIFLPLSRTLVSGLVVLRYRSEMNEIRIGHRSIEYTVTVIVLVLGLYYYTHCRALKYF